MLPGLGDLQQPDNQAGRTQSLYRKYRPINFDADELVGQEHIARTLKNAVARGRVAHAYLFCGPRGTGKTSTARLLAKAVNCLDPDPEKRPCNVCEPCLAISSGSTTDIIEIDAASNRGIDDIRDLRERVRYAPTQLRTKFYILDEAHQITQAAWPAFLKTLEEPPPSTIFVLATTDPDKVPETIASRCQRFDFRPIRREDIAQHVRRVCEREGIAIEDDAVDIVVRRARGGMRDALSLVDQLATAASETEHGVVTADLVRAMLGISSEGWEFEIARALAERDVPGGLRVIGRAVDGGQDMRSFGRRVLDLLRVLLLVRAGADPSEATDAHRDLAERFELPELLRINQQFLDTDYKIRHGGFPQLPLELAFLGSLLGGTQPVAQLAPALAPTPSAPRAATSHDTTPAEPRAPRPARRSEAPTPLRSESPAAPAGGSWGRPGADRPNAGAPPVAPTPIATRRPRTGTSDGALQAVLSGWDRIRGEVKQVNMRAEALLREADPAAVDGDQLAIIVAYPFHAGKLNEPAVRALIEDSIERVTGHRLQCGFHLRDELPGATAVATSPSSSPPTASWTRKSEGDPSSPPSVPVDEAKTEADPLAEPSDDERRLQAARVLFDAVDVEADELALLDSTPPD